MAKKRIHKKFNKNGKKPNKNNEESRNSSLIKRLKLRYPEKIRKIKIKVKKPKNFMNKEKMSKNFIEAQASVRLQCCVCNQNISNQIKIIIEPISAKFKIHQKGLLFNALCINCLVLKTKYDPKNGIYYVENEITLINYKFMEYRILSKMNDPLFTQDWSLGDEIKLLGAVEKLGLGNWEDISKFMNKGKLECESHYYTFYYKEKDNYLINDNSTGIKTKSKEIFQKNKSIENNLLFKLNQNMGFIPFLENKNSNLSFDINNVKKEDNNKLISKNVYNNLGYWPKRNEFDIEYKNEAELLLSELEFNDNDDYRVYNMNYKILQNYNNILDEREERKKLIYEKDLYDVKKQITFYKKLSNEDREIFINLKHTLKYLSNEQFYWYFESNVFLKNLKALLNQLYMYQNLGCQTYEDIQNYINGIKCENYNNHNEENISQNEELINNFNKSFENSFEEDKIVEKKYYIKKFKKSLGKKIQ